MRPHRTPPSPLPAEPYWQALPGSFALLQAIAEEPSDDTLRLILADWLEDHGEVARAEFVRIQVQLQRLPWGDRRSEALLARATRLFEENQERWLAGLPRLEGVCWNDRENFPGGLLERLQVQWTTLERLGAQLFAAADLRRLEVRAADVEGLLDQPWLVHLTALEIQLSIRDEEAAALAASPRLAGLSVLDLQENRIGDAGAAALAASPHLAGLSSLNLGFNWVGDEGVAALAASPHPAGLSSPEPSGNSIGDEGAAALAASPHLARLSYLDLGRPGLNRQANRIGAKGAAALAASPHLAGLSWLKLLGNDIGAEGAAALAASPHLTGLS